MTKNLQYTFYEIVCKDEDKDFIYIGSTKDFKNRKYQHKTACINEKNKIYHLQVYKFIRENGGWDNFNMNPIEILECETKTHARIREQYWIDLKKANLNQLRAFITEDQKKEHEKQYREQNKIKIKENKKQYREKNKERLKEYAKKYYEQKVKSIQNNSVAVSVN